MTTHQAPCNDPKCRLCYMEDEPDSVRPEAPASLAAQMKRERIEAEKRRRSRSTSVQAQPSQPPRNGDTLEIQPLLDGRLELLFYNTSECSHGRPSRVVLSAHHARQLRDYLGSVEL